MSVTPATEVVTRNVSDGVAVLTLNRPDRLNAWVPEMQVQLLRPARAGRRRSRGQGDRGDRRRPRLLRRRRHGGRCSAIGDGRRRRAPTTGPRPSRSPIPKPVIAAVNGPAAGLGLVMALMCDIRFAASGAKLTTAFARRGLIAEHGISWVLPRLVGSAHALDLLFSGRVVLAEEAAQMGLVNAVHPPEELLDRTLDYARELATLLVADLDGGHEAAGLRAPRAGRRREPGRVQPPDGGVVRPPRLRRGRGVLRGGPAPAVRGRERARQLGSGMSLHARAAPRRRLDAGRAGRRRRGRGRRS